MKIVFVLQIDCMIFFQLYYIYLNVITYLNNYIRTVHLNLIETLFYFKWQSQRFTVITCCLFLIYVHLLLQLNSWFKFFISFLLSLHFSCVLSSAFSNLCLILFVFNAILLTFYLYFIFYLFFFVSVIMFRGNVYTFIFYGFSEIQEL